jgi:FAD/FMN-containing dehydrogenase
VTSTDVQPLLFRPRGDDAHWRRLRGEIRGALLTDPASRGRYATDASIYQVEPLAVLVPESDDDVRAAMDACAGWRMPILPRGAGSSQCG